MLAGDLRERHSCAAILYYLFPIYIQSCSSNLPALKFCPSHATFNALNDQTSFEFADRSDNDDHGATQWAGGINVFAETDECDVQVVEFIQNFEKVLYRPRHPVE
jgi:hypothetical protein